MKMEATVGCTLCRRNLCEHCFEGHEAKMQAEMEEGFSVTGQTEYASDQPIVCELCGISVESAKKEEHLFEVHGISG
jgi:hypothetical protein